MQLLKSGDYWNKFLFNTMQEFDQNMVAQIETLKSNVRDMLVSKTEKPSVKIHLIDSICRLGLSYHFEHEIEQVLQHIQNNYVENGELTIEDNLCTISVLFRLLRQQGIHVSPSMS
jgi:(-)-germacrene D synthase